MSGYLARLVSSARAPKPAIRPRLAPVYASSAYESPAEGLLEVNETVKGRADGTLMSPQPEVVTASAARPQPETQPAPEERPAALDSFAKEKGAVSGQFEGPGTVASSETPFRPVVPEVPRSSRPLLETSSQGGPQQKSLPRSGPPLVGQRQEDTRGEPWTPFEAEGLRAAHSEAFQNWSSPTSRIPKIGKGGLTRLDRPERAPDDIQIHIGRIEVTAVPPAPAHPAVPPARKALRLDEYLKRGRERAR